MSDAKKILHCGKMEQPQPKQYKRCEDETLNVDLYLHGKKWREGFKLPIHYMYKGGMSRVDIVQAIRDALPTVAGDNALIQIVMLRKGFEKERVWDWSKLTKETWDVNCADIRGLNAENYVGVNIVPQMIEVARTSANDYLPRFVKEPWREDEPIGHSPQKWWTLEVTSPETGKRVRNPRLPQTLVFPDYPLPPLGVLTQGFGANERPDERANAKINNQARAILRRPASFLSAEERARVDDLLQNIDYDYTILKQRLDTNEEVAKWFKRGFDILPDLERGVYRWVYTGVPKQRANQFNATLSLGATIPDDLKGPADSEMSEFMCGVTLNCDACGNRAHKDKGYVDRLERVYCTEACYHRGQL